MSFEPGALYTLDMARAVRKTKKPFPFTLDVGETDTQINLLVYGSEISPLGAGKQVELMQYLWEVASILETYGVKVNIQGVPGEPRRV